MVQRDNCAENIVLIIVRTIVHNHLASLSA